MSNYAWHASIKRCLGLNLPGFVFLGRLQKSPIPGRQRSCITQLHISQTVLFIVSGYDGSEKVFLPPDGWTMDMFIHLEWAKNKSTFLTGMPCTLSEQWNCRSSLLFEVIFLVGDWKPSSSGNVIKSHRASWILVQVGSSYISAPNAQCMYKKGSSWIPRQNTYGALFRNSIAERTSLLGKETKPLQDFPLNEYSRFLCFQNDVPQVSSAAWNHM